MREKLLNLGLVLTSLMGYLEWGTGHSAFLFQAETEMFLKAWHAPMSVLHPFTLLPVVGQLALLSTLFQRSPGRVRTLAGIAGLGLLLGLMFVIGLLSKNLRILGSTLPFLVLATVTLRRLRRPARA